MIKVRSNLLEFVHNIIISDSDYFDIEARGIGNRIFKYYLDKKIISINFERETTKILQFNLDKYNDDIFMDELKRREFETISDFIRSLFINYINNLRTTREKIIFQDIFSPIENAINFEKQISIKYHGKVRRVDPYFIKAYEQEGRSYLFCYCYKCQDYRNYKISDIKIVYQHVQNRVKRDSKYIENDDSTEEGINRLMKDNFKTSVEKSVEDYIYAKPKDILKELTRLEDSNLHILDVIPKVNAELKYGKVTVKPEVSAKFGFGLKSDLFRLTNIEVKGKLNVEYMW